jgi:hypothetical protein
MAKVFGWGRRFRALLLSLFAGLFGGGCAESCVMAYGPPDDMSLSGAVKDARTGAGIPAIRLRLTGDGSVLEQSSGTNGDFSFTVSWSDAVFTLVAEDVDGAANGEYHPATNTMAQTNRHIEVLLEPRDT